MIVHHALTGKSGAAKVSGYERGSYGRGSKVLLGWTRSQINLAPYGEENNEQIVVASGKCNNAKEFEPFGARLNLETRTYSVDSSIDVKEWQEQIVSSRKVSRANVLMIVEMLKEAGKTGLKKKTIVDTLRQVGKIGASYAYTLIERAESKQLIRHRKGDFRYVLVS